MLLTYLAGGGEYAIVEPCGVIMKGHQVQTDSIWRTQKVRKPLWRRIVRLVFRTAIVLLVVAGAAFLAWSYLADRWLHEQLAAIQATGDPMTFAEMHEAIKPVDPADDAKPFYAAAVDLYRRPSGSDNCDLDFDKALADGKPVSSDLAAKIQKMVDENKLCLEMLDHGGALPGCSYEFGFQYGLMAARFSGPRNLAQAASLRTRMLALAGEGDKAIDSHVSSLRMLRMCDQQPLLITHLIRVSCLNLAAQDVPVILEHGKPSVGQLAKLEAAIKEAEETQDFRRTIIGERVFVLATARKLISTAPKEPWECPSSIEAYPDNWWARPYAKMMVANELEKLNAAGTAAQTDWPNILQAEQAAAVKCSQSKLAAFSQATMPLQMSMTALTGRSLAIARATRVAIMARRYQMETGNLPAGLDELATHFNATLPNDPFTGKPLIYRQAGSGFAVYSVGEVGKDLGIDKINNFADAKDSNWGIRIE
jgi:hypothetical protein